MVQPPRADERLSLTYDLEFGSMAIPVQCPQCQKTTAVPEEYAGRKVKCRCGTVFIVPVPVAMPVDSTTQTASVFDSLDNALFEGPSLARPARKTSRRGFFHAMLGRLRGDKLSATVILVSLGWIFLVTILMPHGKKYPFLVLSLIGLTIAGCALGFPIAKRRGPFGRWFPRPFGSIVIISGLIGFAIFMLPRLLFFAAKCGLRLPRGLVSTEYRGTLHTIAHVLAYTMLLSFAVCFLALMISIGRRLARQFGFFGMANVFFIGSTGPLLLLFTLVCLLHSRHESPWQSSFGTNARPGTMADASSQNERGESYFPASPPRRDSSRPGFPRRPTGTPRHHFGSSRDNLSHGYRKFSGSRANVRLNLLQLKVVQEDLAITSKQRDRLEAFLEEIRRDPPIDGSRMRHLPPSEWVRRNEELNRQIQQRGQQRDARINSMLREVLEPTQLERLGQIWLQAVGFAALDDPDIQKTLVITASQKRKMSVIRTEYRTRTAQDSHSGTLAHERNESREAMEQELERYLLSVLTSEQKSKLERMKGKIIPELQQKSSQ